MDSDTRPRCLHFWLVYNWRTRKKKLFISDTVSEQWDESRKMREALNRKDPDEHLYFCELLIPAGIASEAQADGPLNEKVDMTAHVSREEDETKLQLREGQTIAHYLARRIFCGDADMFPPRAYGPPPQSPLQSDCFAKPEETSPKVFMKIGPRAWKVTVEEMPEDEIKAHWPERTRGSDG